MNFPTIEEHEIFVKYLEEFGSKMDGKEWSSIASKMNWSVQDVKLYAFWYMEELQKQVSHENPEYLVEKDSMKNQGVDDNVKDNDDNIGQKNEKVSWTYGECALFDTLVITYGEKTKNRWEKIASLIPEKDSSQCRERWERKDRK